MLTIVDNEFSPGTLMLATNLLYVFEASTDDPSGGEGGGPTTDTKDFTVS